MSEHTLLPWHNYGPIIHHKGQHIAHVVADKRNADGEMGSDEQRANAEFIVRACNCHDELVAACKLAFDNTPGDTMVYSEGTHGDRVYITDVLRAAIANAEGKSDA